MLRGNSRSYLNRTDDLGFGDPYVTTTPMTHTKRLVSDSNGHVILLTQQFSKLPAYNHLHNQPYYLLATVERLELPIRKNVPPVFETGALPIMLYCHSDMGGNRTHEPVKTSCFQDSLMRQP